MRISKLLREVIEEAEQRGELLTISEAGAEASSIEDDSSSISIQHRPQAVATVAPTTGVNSTVFKN